MDLSKIELACPHWGNEAFKLSGEDGANNEQPFACRKCGEVTPYMSLKTETGETLQERVNQMAMNAFRGMLK